MTDVVIKIKIKQFFECDLYLSKGGWKMKTYRALFVWQKSMDLVKKIYSATRSFPKEELYGLTGQIRRCAVSIPSNIAEGYGRHSATEYVRFLRIATGSLYELQTQIEISLNLDFLKKGDHANLSSRCIEIEKMLSSLINKLGKTTS